MRDFVKSLSKHKFFAKKTSISNRRYAFQAICAQLAILEIEGIKNCKFSDLMIFYDNNKNFGKNSSGAKKIVKVIQVMDRIFDKKTVAFRNRASIISFYLLLSEILKKNNKTTKTQLKKLKKFYINFQEDLRNEVEKGSNATDTELIVYQSNVNQAADAKESIFKRHKILIKRLIQYDRSYIELLGLSEKELQVMNLSGKNDIKQLSNQCLTTMYSINKIFNSKKEEDLFKLTTEVLKGITSISTLVKNKQDFKDCVDSLYKTFYEGSGSLKRIPRDLLLDKSVFLDIKHLRTDLFHDIEHGKPKEIKKKKNVITKIYKKYTGKKSVEEIKDDIFVDFQIKLLKNINKELDSIKSTISQNNF